MGRVPGRVLCPGRDCENLHPPPRQNGQLAKICTGEPPGSGNCENMHSAKIIYPPLWLRLILQGAALGVCISTSARQRACCGSACWAAAQVESLPSLPPARRRRHCSDKFATRSCGRLESRYETLHTSCQSPVARGGLAVVRALFGLAAAPAARSSSTRRTDRARAAAAHRRRQSRR